MTPAQKIIIALDFHDARTATDMARLLAPTGVKFKIGMELFYAVGPKIIESIAGHGPVFLDLKLHDIPETMARAAVTLVRTACVWMLNVHAAAGMTALRDVSEHTREAAAQHNCKPPLIIGVTVLTSLADLSHLGSRHSAGEIAMELSRLCHHAGLDGVVCSPLETARIKTVARNFLCVTPGIRPQGEPAHDQIRTATPREAIEAGSDYLVIGRPVTRAKDPVAALNGIIAELT